MGIGALWVLVLVEWLAAKALPKFIENAPAVISAEDVAMAAYHLSRYVREESRSAA